MITVAIADDQTLLRDLLATLINTFEGYQVVCSTSNGRELTDFVNKGKAPDIAILDVKMPDMNGFATAAWLKKYHPDTRVIMLTSYDSEIMMIRLMAKGVRCFLNKDISPVELKEALRQVMQKGYYYQGDNSEKLANLFLNIPGNTSSIDSVMLSKNEIQFIRLACTDSTYKEIADIMNLSQRTIDSMRDSLFDKLKVNSRVTLVLYAVHHGIFFEE